MKKSKGYLIFIFLFSSNLKAQAFEMAELPIGKEITLLTPARTQLSPKEKLTFTPTDLPQSIQIDATKFSAKSSGNILIKTKKGDKMLKIKAGSLTIFPFYDLEPIEFYGEWKEGANLEVTSDKPLTLGKR